MLHLFDQKYSKNSNIVNILQFKIISVLIYSKI